MLHWSKLLVNFFRTSAFSAAPEDLLTRNFHREVELVTTFGQRVSKLSVDDSQSEFQRILLLGLTDAKIGIYSIFHDNAGKSCLVLLFSPPYHSIVLNDHSLPYSLRARIRASINHPSGLYVSISPY
jgi:hypothetical protein